MENPYYPVKSVIQDVIVETPTIKTLVIKPEKPMPFRSGQFMQLTIPGIGEAPFTPSSSPSRPEMIDITLLKTGRLTNYAHELKKGAIVGLRGGFGKGYPLDKCEGKEILVVGGGVGLAPLRALLYYLFENTDKVKRISIKYGARIPDELCYTREYDKWRKISKTDLTITIDKPHPDWSGRVGLVTTLLDNLDINLNNSIAVSCGPEIMLKFVSAKLVSVGFKPEQIYLSMNRRMSCGIGKCGRCNVGGYLLCKDGPDMNYAKIKDVPGVFS
jgi:NAD(P)H-flavin reductase